MQLSIDRSVLCCVLQAAKAQLGEKVRAVIEQEQEIAAKQSTMDEEKAKLEEKMKELTATLTRDRERVTGPFSPLTDFPVFLLLARAPPTPAPCHLFS